MRRRLRALVGLVRRRRTISRYLRTHNTRKLHLGAGENVLPGWLNADLHDYGRRDLVYLDARKPFPLSDESFELVFSEHMLEHLTYADGLSCLRECRRVLRSGGRIRVATPSLQKLAELYDAELSDVQRRYLAWATESFLQDAGKQLPGFVINNFVRAWGHEFVYDRDTLSHALRSVGFVDVEEHGVGDTGLERHLAEAPEFNEYETLVLEARRP